MSYARMKRALDLAFAILLCPVLLPVMGILALIIRLDSPGPILFRQKRVGRDRTHFDILKFRTMRVDTPKDTPTHLLHDPARYITRVGRFLRASSLDELPQLFNILRGEMSFVGPRPALWNQYDLVAERERVRANGVLPGLTGWAQVNGRDELPIPVKARLDGEYVRRMGPLFDLRIVGLTLVRVFARSGVVEGGTGRAEERTAPAQPPRTSSREPGASVPPPPLDAGGDAEDSQDGIRA